MHCSLESHELQKALKPAQQLKQGSSPASPLSTIEQAEDSNIESKLRSLITQVY